MKTYIIALSTILLIGSGCTGEAPLNSGVTPTNNSAWALQSEGFEAVSSEITSWAEVNFSTLTGVEVGDVNTEVQAEGELKLVASYRANVIEIPEGRQFSDYGDPQEPTDFYAYVLSDEDGNLFRTFVESLDGELFKVNSFGPVKDHRTDSESYGESMAVWPAQDLQDLASTDGASLVMIPYPYAMNQMYYQFGNDITSARLVNVESGQEYTGLSGLLDAIEADWKSL